MRVLKHLYVQVLIGLAAGILVGYFWPDLGVQMKPFGDTFIRLIKMLITLVIFCTVSVGIARMENLKQVGRVGLKTIVYFEAVTTVALVIGLVVANLLHPGSGLNIDPKTLDTHAVSHYVTEVHAQSNTSFLEEIVPNSVVGAFARGDLLQVLLFSVLFGIALSIMSRRSRFLSRVIEQSGEALMRIVEMIMRLAPLGAFGAMAFTVGKYGISTLQQLGLLIVCFYLTSILFIALVLGTICRWAGVGLWPLLKYLREELLIVLGTSTTESVLPRLMEKLERLGCPKPVVGLVLPTGYSFNLDGAAIYLTMTSLFIAQATNTHLTLLQQIGLLAILMVTSKGGAGVAGAALVALTATLSTHNIIPVAGITLILGIDRVLNEIRAIVNMIGNAVATIVVARWEGAFDVQAARKLLAAPPEVQRGEPQANASDVNDMAPPAYVQERSN
ncbi:MULTISPECIES: C4-dicarboxylate transporter DctA [unclassified Paraburkholderia]|uniref:C4-dicarboxylate transporter DctA n=1 Tax=unclassified Paraburkholderia TaxID=2615204 RepID=UPI00160FF7C3|nr:aerobic C4-dicarboxylate transport protein [Paraburkholderia sp. HC6.4b]MBB5454830.1 aerobic C4-dicarboxylate transport protein [Paraburkholderia sp. Kb1A]MBB5495964.1 aerobic C4-dicarboxylate transport protein [Paraburkholderia sp. MM5384-R2]MBC8730650.1 C4-dicarboxylate transporter DctA [Paraburkholderia sp. UCT2]